MNPRLLWTSPLFNFSGEALFSRRTIPLLEQSGYSVGVNPTLNARHFEYSDKEWQPRLALQPPFPISITLFKSKAEKPSSDFSVAWLSTPANGLTVLERDLTGFDEIWVPSRQLLSATSRLKLGKKAIQLMPFGVDTELFNPISAKPLGLSGLRKFNFLSVFSMNGSKRKGWDILLRAYAEAFSPADDVTLILRTSGSNSDPQSAQRTVIEFLNSIGRNVDNVPDLILYNDFIPEEFFPDLYKSADVFVLPSRCESFGFAVAEAMAMGLPAIATNHGGHTDYLNNRNGYPLEVDNFIRAEGEHSGFSWAEPSYLRLADLMRHAYENPDEVKAKGLQARADIVNNYSIENTAKAVCSRLEGTKTLSKQTTPQSNHLGAQETKASTSMVIQQESPSSRKVSATSGSRPTIAIDARTLIYEGSTARGIGHYSVYHLEKVIELTPSWNYRLYFEELDTNKSVERLTRFPNVSCSTYDYQEPIKADLFHVPDPLNTLEGFDSPFRLAPRGPITSIIYDFIPLTCADMHFNNWSKPAQAAYRNRLKQMVQANVHLLAISEHTRKDALHYVELPEDSVTTIYAGLNKSKRKTLVSPEKIAEVRSKFGLTQPFFMSVGSLDPHKNAATAFQAYILANNQLPMQYVIAGSLDDPYKIGFKAQLEKANVKGFIFTGYLEREELEALFSSSSGLLFPSFYEGFGFPVLEAMASGCPVICSNASSLPEVAGDAALLFPPTDPDAITQAMLRLATDKALRQELIDRGYKQAKKFTWERTAQLTIGVWEKLLGKRADKKIAFQPFELQLPN